MTVGPVSAPAPNETGSGARLMVAGKPTMATPDPAGKYEPRADALASTRKRRPYERFLKPLLDRITGLVLTVLTLPVVLILSLYVLARIGRPILYREDRVGQNGKVFKMNRLRTMRLATSPDDDFDSRIAPAGRFLRRWSLDEIPQAWNILLGHMSLVGPRPERTGIVDQYSPWQHQRHQVKPGATGLWQVTARGDGRHMHEHVEIDLAYIEGLSFLYDLRILATTVGAVLRRPERPSVIPGIVDTLALPKRSWREMGYLSFKRLSDLIVATVLLVLLSPFMLAVAVAIKIDSPGRVLFRQVRVGHQGRLFRVIKYRSMEQDISEELHRTHYAELAAQDAAVIRIPDDPRITRVGKVLRGWSIDELPNLWNVLKGEMSLVGPRPLVPYELDLYSRAHLRRLDAKPGITGMAQVEGRTDISMEDRVRLDLEYVDRRSTWFDIKVVARTVVAVFTTRGA
jgi:lipopolysaccharide/colanic/teichoic acid biosynthesis glycosyltransferase